MIRIPIVTGLSFIVVSASVASPDQIQERLINAFDSIDQTQLTYFVVEDYTPSIPESQLRQRARNYDLARQMYEDRLDGEISEEFIAYENFSTQQLKDRLDSMEGWDTPPEPEDAVYEFSRQLDRIRLNVNRIENEEASCFYVYDGKEGVLHINEKNSTRINPGFTHLWTNFHFFSEYGSGLALFLENKSEIVTYDEETRTVTVESPFDSSRTSTTVFEMSEEHPDYWTKATMVEQGVELQVIECAEFQEVNGLLVPASVIVSMPREIDGEVVMHPVKTMSLIDAKVNEQFEFVEDHFRMPLNDGSEVVIMSRN